MLRNILVCNLFFVLSLVTYAQNRNAVVYFNAAFGIDFLNRQLLGPTNRPVSFSMSSICDEKTGELLFYADCRGVYTPDHFLMKNGEFDRGGTSSALPMIVPDHSLEQSYYVFYILNKSLYYTTVDAKNAVMSKATLLYAGVSTEIQCMSYIHKQGWWLVTHSQSGNEYYAFLILKSGIVKTPVVSRIGQDHSLYTSSFECSSHTGGKLLEWEISMRGPNQKGERLVNLLDFDKRCGVFYSSKIIYKDSAEHFINMSLSCAFSPDDSKIFLNVDSSVIQFSGNNYADTTMCISLSHDLAGSVMYSGQDGYVYYMNFNNRNSDYNIYRISNPNEKYPLCDFLLWKTTDKITTAIYDVGVYSPRQIMDDSYLLNLPDPIDFVYDSVCAGYNVQFKTVNDTLYDSVVWYFEDSDISARSSGRAPVHVYSREADYKVKLIAYICGIPDTVIKTISVWEKAAVDLGPDTFICYGDRVELLSDVSAGSYLWSDSSNKASLWVAKEGKYWLLVKNGGCIAADTIDVIQIPDLWTELKEEYFICNDDKELVKLDAGGDFAKYKWSPTGDTSQWIIVGDVGAYFVIVKDFRGCKGAGGTKVKRRCPVSVFYPNAFTPNNDGVNDIYLPVGSDLISFRIDIYNAWGQKLFTGNQMAEGWDGTVNGVPAPTGTYIYKSSYSGFSGKKMMEFEKEGNITLLR